MLGDKHSAGVEIARADVAECAEIAEMENICFPDAWSESSVRSNLESACGFCYVARADGVPVGYLCGSFIVPEMEIFRVATLPEYRRRGIGEAMLRRALADFGSDISVYLEVRTSNVAAIALYGSLGFDVVCERKNYYSNPTENALVMKRE